MQPDMPRFDKPVLVYLPCYNCGDRLAEVFAGIPEELHGRMEALVVDNQSADGTGAEAVRLVREGLLPYRLHVVRPRRNLGYAGSQKLAYWLATRSPAVRRVIMLHGDGQYSSCMVSQFLPHLDGPYAIVNGYRDKKVWGRREETPFTTYAVIKTLNWIESFVTRYRYREWHSGFVMYSTDLLRQVPLQDLTASMHFDAEMLMCAGALGLPVLAVPIFKLYKDRRTFGGMGRIKYVLQAFKLMFQCRLGRHRRLLRRGGPNVASEFDVLA